MEEQIWCGDGSKPQDYVRNGSRQECLRKGFGAGMYTERAKYLPKNSLQRIKYVGPKMEANFILYSITNTDELIQTLKGWSRPQKENALKYILQNENGGLNRKAYNSVLLYLHSKGILRLPSCVLNN